MRKITDQEEKRRRAIAEAVDAGLPEDEAGYFLDAVMNTPPRVGAASRHVAKALLEGVDSLEGHEEITLFLNLIRRTIDVAQAKP